MNKMLGKITIILLLASISVACNKHYKAGNKELPLGKSAFYPSKQFPHKAKTDATKKPSNLDKIDKNAPGAPQITHVSPQNIPSGS